DRAMTEVAPDLGSHANPGRRPWRIEGRPPEREPGLVAARRRATDATGAARERCRALAAYPPAPSPRQAYSGASAGEDPSTGNPSFLQSPIPPIISLTRKPRAASLAAALVEPLHPGPQQYATITLSRGRDAAVSGLMVR